MIRINLLAEERGKKGRSGVPVAAAAGGPPRAAAEGGPPMAIFGAILIAFLAVAFGLMGYYYIQNNGMEKKVADQKKELEKYKGAREKVQQLEQRKVEFAAKLDQITQLKERQSLPVKLLNHMVEVLPDGAWYTGLQASTAGAVKVDGMARSIKTISTYYDNVVALPDFTNVQMGNIKQGSGPVEVYTFQISFTYVPGVPRQQQPDAGATKKAPAKPAAAKPAGGVPQGI